MLPNDLIKVKEQFFKQKYYVDYSNFIASYKNVLIKSNYKIDVFFEWFDELLISNCKRNENKISNSISLTKNIWKNDIIRELWCCFGGGYLPNYNTCLCLLDLIIKSNNCFVENSKDFLNIKTNFNLLDAFAFTEYLDKDPYSFYCFQGLMINDFDILKINYCYFLGKPPFETGKRFSGFLAHLFYSGYTDIYEKLCELLIDLLKRNFTVLKSLFCHFYSFCKVFDEKKIKILDKMIDEMRINGEEINLDVRLSDCYVYLPEKISDSLTVTISKILNLK